MELLENKHPHLPSAWSGLGFHYPSFLLSWSDVYMCVFMHTCVYVYVCMCVHEGVSEKLLLGRKLHSMSM